MALGNSGNQTNALVQNDIVSNNYLPNIMEKNDEISNVSMDTSQIDPDDHDVTKFLILGIS